MGNRFLFRGKRLDNGEWVVGGFYRHFDGRIGVMTGDEAYKGSAIMDEVDPATVGQCTGLIAAKSYRGENEEDRLIFDGDICQSIDGLFLVAWDDDKAAFIMRFIDEPDFLYMEEIQDDTEIVGNIYDNLDLLGVSND